MFTTWKKQKGKLEFSLQLNKANLINRGGIEYMKLGLALAGGGIRGAAHIGALKALEENKIKIDAISRNISRKYSSKPICNGI